MSFLMDYWDSINIGRPELNHSQGFFRRTHSLHEKEVEFNVKKTIPHQLAQKEASKAEEKVTATEKNLPKQKAASNKENVPINNPMKSRAILAVSIVKKPEIAASKSNVTNTGKNVLQKSSSIATSSMNLKKNEKVLTKSISQQKLTSTKLYEYADIQKRNKEMLAKKIKAEEERELKFKFQAKPVPKFIKTVSIQGTSKPQPPKVDETKKNLIKQNSLPVLPNSKKPVSLVPSCGDPERIKAMEEHRKQVVEKYKQENIKFQAKPASVLQKAVFQPKHNYKAVDAKPFKLILTQRMIQRSTFDKHLQESYAIRERQREIINRQKDLEDRKLIRQKTLFKARPNPFGHGY